jgi:uncharacterized membrane protein
MLFSLAVLSLLSLGLFAGVMLALVAILQRQWALQSREDYVPYFRSFLLVAKGNPIISVLTFAGFLGPFGMSVYALSNQALTQGVFYACAGLTFLIGCLGVTLRLNFPIYDQVTQWVTPEAALEWASVRNRFFRLNLIRLGAAIAAFLLVAYGMSV